MSGISGGEVDEASLRKMLDGISGDDSEIRWRHEAGNYSLGIRYPQTDPHGAAVWEDGSRAGVIYGAITNLDELSLTVDQALEQLLDRPTEVAPKLEGGFLIVCYDATDNRFVLVTDKLGARSCYYTTNAGFQFATAVDVLLPNIKEPTLNAQAANDMLLMGHLWGDHTLVTQIKAMRPATVLEVVNGKRSFERYWKPDYSEEESGPEYVTELVNRYRQAIRRTSKTLPSEAGIWLSGGLDSRTTASALMEQTSPEGFNTLRAYTYNANPPTGDNTRIASDVAQRLGIPLKQIPFTAETVAENFEQIIEATDGTVRWISTLNLSATYAVDRVSPVMMEGMQGALVGDHLLRHHLDGSRSAVEAQYESEAGSSVEAVQRVLSPDIDPFSTFKEEVKYTSELSSREQVLDIHFQNYYNRHTLASNRLMRDCGGSRVPHADGDYLEWCAKLPHQYRKGTVSLPIGQEDRIPLGTSPVKLELSRSISPELTDITYERTKIKPKWPYPFHVGGFFTNVIVNRLRSKPTYGNGQLADFWIRDVDTRLHDRVAKLVDDAASRDLFDGDAVRETFDAHMSGANNAPMISQITTLEYWIQTHLD